MKLLIFSDSHGTICHMLQAIRQEKPDYVIHLGDYGSDVDVIRKEYPMLPVTNVRGNCDYSEFDLPEQRLVEYGGVRVLMAHGHRYGVKSGLLRYYMAARENQVDVALFGHTHCAYCEEKEDIWLLNPGSCGNYRPTYGIVGINNGQVFCSVKSILESEEIL